MALAHIDSLHDLSMDEDRGAIRSLTRVARVQLHSGDLQVAVLPNPGNPSDPDTILGNDRRDHRVLQVALMCLNDAGYGPMSRIVLPENSENPFNYLVLIKRSPKVMDDPRWVEVVLRYEHVIDGPNQILMPVERQNVYARGRCSIVEKTTNFFYPDGDDRPEGEGGPGRQMILTAHTYPPNTVGAALNARDPKTPRTVIAGGEISIPYPQANIRLEGIYTCNLTTKTPYQVAKSIIRHVNLLTWNSDPPFTWLCTEVSWELNGYMPLSLINALIPPSLPDLLEPVRPEGFPQGFPQYKMSFEFQYNSDTWDPFVVFQDPDQGRPPADVRVSRPDDANATFTEYANGSIVWNKYRHPDTDFEIAAGAWKVPALPRLDFKAFFLNANIDGVPNG